MITILTRFKWQLRAIFALTCLCTFTFASARLDFAAVTLIQLSTDPYTNSSSQHQTEVEPDVFSYGSTLVSAFQVGRFPVRSGGSDNIGWATSTNYGLSWTHGFLPGITIYAGGKFARVSSPSVAYDARYKVWLIGSQAFYPLLIGGGSAQVVSRSTDGLNWDKPVIVTDLGRKLVLDKNWITCDNSVISPYYGNCYDEFDSHRQGDLILMNTSTDGGKTWKGALTTANRGTGIGGQPLVQPNGTVIVPITTLLAPIDETGGPSIPNIYHNNVLVFSSTNGGASWGNTSVIQYIFARKVAGGLRANPITSAAIDGSGKIYIVWPDCRFESKCKADDLVMTTSTNGLTWSSVKRIPIDGIGSGVDHFIPTLGVDTSTSGNTAHLGILYYYYPVASCFPTTCQLDVGYVSSTDGGLTFTHSVQLAGPMKLAWLPRSEEGLMLGDYMGVAFSAGQAHPIFIVASPPVGGVACTSPGAICHEAAFTMSEGL